MTIDDEEKEAGIPNPLLDKQAEISYEKRESLMVFNTIRFWWCYYDPETGTLYNEYCRRLMDDATEYLQDIGLLSHDRQRLKLVER